MDGQNDTVILSILMSCGPKSPDSLGDGEFDCVERPTVNGSARIDLRKTQRKENDLVNLFGLDSNKATPDCMA